MLDETYTAILKEAVDLQIRGDFSGAETKYKFILDKYPSHQQTLNNYGFMLVQAGKTDMAIEILEKTIQSYPGYGTAHANLGHAWAMQLNFEKAKDCYLKAMEIEPCYQPALEGLLQIAVFQQDIAAAENYCQQLLTSDPHHLEARYQLGAVLLAQNKLKAGITNLEIVYDAQPDYKDVQAELALGFILAHNYGTAISLLKHAIQCRHNYIKARNYLALAYLRTGDEAAAMNQYEAILELNPRHSDTMCNLAVLSLAAGQLKKAMQLISEARIIDPDNIKYQYHEAQCHLRAGNILTAKTILENIVKSETPNYSDFAAEQLLILNQRMKQKADS